MRREVILQREQPNRSLMEDGAHGRKPFHDPG